MAQPPAPLYHGIDRLLLALAPGSPLMPRLQAAAPQAAPVLLEQLFGWRHAMLGELGPPKNALSQRKQVGRG